MSKDYKSGSKAGTAGKGGSGSPIIAGALIGLCLGVALTAGGAWYLSKRGNLFGNGALPPQTPDTAAPHVQEVPKTEVLTPQGAAGTVPVPKPGEPASNVSPQAPASKDTAKDKAGADRFDFYTMLPEQNDKNSAAKDATAADAPPAKVQLPKGNYLQVGAFHDESDANNLKAKLALIGVEANLETNDVAGQGVIHRVRVGPIPSDAEIDRIRGLLKANGIDAALVKN